MPPKACIGNIRILISILGVPRYTTLKTKRYYRSSDNKGGDRVKVVIHGDAVPLSPNSLSDPKMPLYGVVTIKRNHYDGNIYIDEVEGLGFFMRGNYSEELFSIGGCRYADGSYIELLRNLKMPLPRKLP